MAQLRKITLPLVNPVHIGPILQACRDATASDNLAPRIEAVRFDVGDNMRSDDNVRLLVDAGVLTATAGTIHLTPDGQEAIADVFSLGEFDATRWLRFLFSAPSPEAPARFFIHHGIRHLHDAGPQPTKAALRESFTAHLRRLPEVLEYLIEQNIQPDDWWFSDASLDRLVRCLRVWGALDDEAAGIALAINPDDLRADAVDDTLSLDEFWTRLLMAYQSLVFRHPDQKMFPIWMLRQAFLDIHPLSQGRFYTLLEEVAYDGELRDLVTLYHGAGANDRQEFLQVTRGGTRDMFYLIQIRA